MRFQSIALYALFALVAGPATATVTLSTSFLTPPTFDIGSTVTVRVIVDNNTGGQIPSAAAVRFGYDTSLFSYVSASGDSVDGFLGGVDPFAVGAEEPVSGTFVTRDIPTVGNFINTDPTPVVVDVVLQVVAKSAVPTSLSLDFDPGVSAGLNSLLDTDGLPILGRTVNTSATDNLVVPVTVSGFDVE